MPTCEDCHCQYEKTNHLQKRCSTCIDLNPHRGRSRASRLGDRYVKEAEKRLRQNVKHWNVKMGQNRLKEMFPDVVQVGAQSH